jgi:hypothetical protein
MFVVKKEKAQINGSSGFRAPCLGQLQLAKPNAFVSPITLSLVSMLLQEVGSQMPLQESNTLLPSFSIFITSTSTSIAYDPYPTSQASVFQSQIFF